MASLGLKIAVSSNSHAVINNLLIKVKESCESKNYEVVVFKSENRSKPDEDLLNNEISTIPTKKISENILDDIFNLLIENIKKHKKVKISKFGTFSMRRKNSRIGRNPLTKEKKIISSRNVVLFKPSKEFKDLINSSNNDQI